MRAEQDYDDFTLRDYNEKELSGSLSPFTFLCLVILLMMIGLINAYSASYDTALKSGLSHYYYFVEVILFEAFAILAGIFLFFVPEKRCEKIYIFTSLLAFLFLFFNYFVSFTGKNIVFFSDVRSGDVIIFSSVLFVASVFPKIKNRDRRGWIYILYFTLSIALEFSLIYLGQSSYALLFVLISIASVFKSGIEKRYTVTFALFSLSFFVFFIFILPSLDNVFFRLMPYSSLNEITERASNCISAITEGGIFGKGIGKGYYKLGIIENVHTDYIFSSFVEEMGLVGVSIFFIILLLFLYLGIRSSRRADMISDEFASVIIYSFSFLIFLKAALSALICANVIPLDGLSFPFLSTDGIEEFILIIECAFLYKFIHLSGRGRL